MSDRLANGAAWVLGARVYLIFALMVQTTVVARLLGPEIYGLAAIATMVAAIVEMATKQSLVTALVQLPEVEEEHLHTAFTLNLCRGLVIAVVLTGLAYPIARLYDEPEVTAMLLVLAASTGIFGIANPKLYVLNKRLEFRQDFIRSVLERSLSLAVSISIALYYGSYWAVILGTVAGQLSMVASSFFWQPFLPRLSLAKARDLLSFSIWVTLSQFLQAAITRIDQLLAGYLLGNAVLGTLNVATRISSAPTQETSFPILNTAFPAFAKLYPDLGKLRPAYQRVQTLVALISFPVACGMVMVARPLVDLFLGPQWGQAIIVIQFFAVAFGLEAFTSAVNPLAMAMGRTRSLFMRTFVTTAVRLAMVIPALWLFGLIGMLVARLVYGLIFTAVNMRLLREMLGIGYGKLMGVHLRTILGSLVMMVAVWLADFWVRRGTEVFGLLFELVAKVSIGGAVFVLVLAMMRRITGRPGPEQELLNQVGRVLQRIGFLRKRRKKAA